MSLNIYFCGSIRGGRSDAPLYAKLIEHLKTYGKVFTEHVGNPNVVAEEKALCPHKDEKSFHKYIHDRDLEWLQQTDVVIAEVTTPSLGVGYEVGRALYFKVPMLCLFRPSTGTALSAMIAGAQHGDRMIVRHYEELAGKDVIDEYMSTVTKRDGEVPAIMPGTMSADLPSKVKNKELKIYFAGSISGGRNDTHIYKSHIAHLKQYGCVLTEIVGNPTFDENKVKGEELEELKRTIFAQDMKWLEEADVFIAEVTQPSLGVGFEVATAASWGKPVLCMFRPSSNRTLSGMIGGADNGENFQVLYYEEEDGKRLLDEFIGGLGKQSAATR